MNLPVDSAQKALARARAWPFTRPLLRGALAGAVLLVLVVVGRATFAGPPPRAISATLADSALAAPPSAPPSEPSQAASAEPPPLAQAPPALPAPAAEAPSPVPAQPGVHGPATPDDPVILNDATAEDLQRLPGVGQKRALAILDLRTRLGHFHQIEDLLKVRGIGLKTLRRLRPLVRLDRPPPADGGAG